MSVKRWIPLMAIAFLLSMQAFGQIEFRNLTMDENSQVLFTAQANAPLHGSYSTGFKADLNNRTIRQLSFFPERISVLDTNGKLQIQNRFGVFRTEQDFTDFQPVTAYPSFVNGAEIRTGKIEPMETSPNGRWLTYIERTSPAFGNLILVEVTTGRRFTISNSIEVNLSGQIVSWSPDSEFFIYHKANRIYYFSLDQLSANRILAENFRSLGQGQISNVFWSNENELYYISGSLIYRALGVEFFTRSLYQEFLRVGTIVGTIPFIFDPNFDRFWISPDGTQLLLDRGGRSLYLYFLQNNDFTAQGAVIQLPYLLLPRNTRVNRVLWSDEGFITVLTQSLNGGGRVSTLYRLDASARVQNFQFQAIEDPQVLDIVLSPRESRVAVLFPDRVEIRSYTSWQLQQTLNHTNPLHALFLTENQIILAGQNYGELVDLETTSSRFLFFSQAETLGFAQNNGQVLVQQGSGFRELDSSTGTWIPRQAPAQGQSLVAPPNSVSRNFRVFLENLTSGSYRNIVMVRNIRDVGTVSLFDPPSTRFEPFPTRDDPVSFNPFIHGSRIRRREVSLVFNAINSVEGLTTILNTLADYNIRATFFLNGEFIRRHPGAVQEIAQSGHEVGNLFTVYFDMSDTRFQITNQFIQQGLARNEDEFFETTGRELSLIWHAPFYFTNPTILQAGAAMNYTYVGRDVDSLDWVPRRDETGISRLYFPSAELVESVIERKRPGSIIAMTIGRPGDDRPDGGRDDYLFNKLDILLNNLIERGYSMVPVTELIDRAR
jgi:peptidoglycan/xylan/chitin deacetylase (PgdA/CDA1 family)